MSDAFETTVKNAKMMGWKTERVCKKGIVFYILKNPDDRYVQTGCTEDALWKFAYMSGILPTKRAS